MKGLYVRYIFHGKIGNRWRSHVCDYSMEKDRTVASSVGKNSRRSPMTEGSSPEREKGRVFIFHLRDGNYSLRLKEGDRLLNQQ